MNAAVIGALVGALLLGGSAETTPTAPRHYFRDGTLATTGNSDSFQNDWYSRHLQAMDEPILEPSASTRSYRFLWLRAFHHPVAVRVTIDAKGGRLVATELDGAGGYAPGKLLRRTQRALSAAEAVRFERAMEQDGLWTIAANEEARGLDGSQWIVEGAAKQHRVVQRWTPDNGPVRTMGNRFLSLAGWTFTDVY